MREGSLRTMHAVIVRSLFHRAHRHRNVVSHAYLTHAPTPHTAVNHDKQAPVLATCFSDDGSTVFSGGADHAVRMWQLGQTPTGNIATQIGSHDAPVKSVGFLRSTNLIVSGGWDRKLKFWDARSPNPAGTFVSLVPQKIRGQVLRDCQPLTPFSSFQASLTSQSACTTWTSATTCWSLRRQVGT